MPKTLSIVKKRIHQKITTSQTLEFIKNEIHFPKKTWASIAFRYTSAILITSFALLVIQLFSFGRGDGTVFLLFILSVILSAWIGSFGAGLLSTCFAVVSLIVIFLSSGELSQFGTLLNIYIFLTAGILISIVIDLSKRMDLISVYNAREMQYQKLIAELTRENEKAQEEIKVRDEFLSIASHELKTPLTSTLLKLQTVLHNVRNVSLAKFSVQSLLEMLESAEQQTKRLSKMINDLLNVSLIRTGRMHLEPEEGDLSKIIQDVVGRFTEKAQKEKVKISVNAQKPVHGKFDVLRIEQVMTNLISNALKYGDKKPIEVKVEKNGTTGKIIVRDRGIGIPGKERDKIFQLFTRAANGGAYQGMGVGLYITNQIVKAHHGEIDVDSREGHGSTFTITLPLKD